MCVTIFTVFENPIYLVIRPFLPSKKRKTKDSTNHLEFGSVLEGEHSKEELQKNGIFFYFLGHSIETMLLREMGPQLKLPINVLSVGG